MIFSSDVCVALLGVRYPSILPSWKGVVDFMLLLLYRLQESPIFHWMEGLLGFKTIWEVVMKMKYPTLLLGIEL
jgi:hypothetical protein